MLPIPRLRHRGLLLMPLVLGLLIVGCDDNRQLVELSRESLDRQAEQNQALAQQSQAVTETTRELIHAEADVQKGATQLHQNLSAERATLDQERSVLESERRSLAAARNREPIIAESIKGIVLVLVAALPLVVCWHLVKSLFLTVSDESAAANILIEQLAGPASLLGTAALSALPQEPDRQPLHRPLALPSQLSHPGAADPPPAAQSSQRLLLVVEGRHDIQCLYRLSRMLHQHDPALPDLEQLETDGLLTVLTAGTTQLPGSRLAFERQWHLYDRELPPVTQERLRLIAELNLRPGCRGLLTDKRALENYLHPAAIEEASGLVVEFGDVDDVADLVAQASFHRDERGHWETLTRRARRKLREKAKRWLNREAAERMTFTRLSQRDPQGEVIGWLATIAELVGHTEHEWN